LLKNRPLLVGVSRKRFLTTVLEKEKKDILIKTATCRSSTEDMSSLETHINDRDLATSGACCAAILGGAHFLRVHNVKDVVSVCSVFSAVMFQ
jgi:dihydropteroate synthase